MEVAIVKLVHETSGITSVKPTRTYLAGNNYSHENKENLSTSPLIKKKKERKGKCHKNLKRKHQSLQRREKYFQMSYVYVVVHCESLVSFKIQTPSVTKSTHARDKKKVFFFK
ncbi:hypothetical protein V8G54_016618 [Vigna mungo]|uniref:Uncharacterized protein n=1 Tax=Vigna mungo TaxID=3915 RepID=A0AAQ3NNB6_VIGMU